MGCDGECWVNVIWVIVEERRPVWCMVYVPAQILRILDPGNWE